MSSRKYAKDSLHSVTNPPRGAVVADVVAALEAALPEGAVSISGGDLDDHSHDGSPQEPHAPDIVVWPETTEHVQAALRIANEVAVPVTPWGAGTSLEGNPIPACGGIVLDCQRMNRIVEVYPADFQVTVEPGVLYKDLNEELGKSGLFFAPDPGANASIGGMVANNAAGIRTVKYGATKDNVLALEVVLANGNVIQTGSRSVKQSAGYDLTHLFIGSEGTLGVITQATLNLAPLPEHFSAVVAAFESVTGAAQTVFEIMAANLDPAAMELLDGPGIALVNQREGFDLLEKPTLLMEFSDATESSLQTRLELAEAIARNNDCLTLTSAVARDEREQIWAARHRFFEVLVQSHPGQKWIIADVAVPISQLPAIVALAQTIIQEDYPGASIIGHAGDGNLHVTFFYPPDDAAMRAKAQECNARLVQEAVRLGGTITGEHGVGLGKKDYMPWQFTPETLALMKTLKQTLDPKEILNPGKLF